MSWKPNGSPPRPLIPAALTEADRRNRDRQRGIHQSGGFMRHAAGAEDASAFAMGLLALSLLGRRRQLRTNPNIEAEIDAKRQILLPNKVG